MCPVKYIYLYINIYLRILYIYIIYINDSQSYRSYVVLPVIVSTYCTLNFLDDWNGRNDCNNSRELPRERITIINWSTTWHKKFLSPFALIASHPFCSSFTSNIDSPPISTGPSFLAAMYWLPKKDYVFVTLIELCLFFLNTCPFWYRRWWCVGRYSGSRFGIA